MSVVGTNRRVASRIVKSFAMLAVAGVLGVVTLLVSLLVEHSIGITLPKPTGPFAVGRALYDWVDDGHLDSLAPAADTKRELLVWIWYPATVGNAALVEDYLPAPMRAEVERSSGALFGKLLTRDLSKVRAHSIRKADVASQQQPIPIVILRAGASAEVWNYSTLAEDLASHGYVVVGFDAPYRTSVVVFPDGRVMNRLAQNNPELCLEMPSQERDRCADKLLAAWTGDMTFVLDRLEQLNTADATGTFTGRLDTTRVGVFGHSFGGAAALRFCHEDRRCKAGVDVDGAPHGRVIQEGVGKPVMFLLSDHRRESDRESGQIMTDIRSIYDRLPEDERTFAEIRGGNHFLFSDDGALLKSHIVMRTLRLFGIIGIKGRRQLEVTAYCLRGFFDTYLKGPGGSRPEISSSVYPELEVHNGNVQ